MPKKPVPQPREPRMYVIVRRDLSDSYRMVQGAHALAEYASRFPNRFIDWGNEYLIFLSVFNLKELRKLIGKMEERSEKFATFEEPDLDNHSTALACYTTGECFDGLPLA